MKIAVSLLSAYLYCPRKVFLEKVLGMREPIKQPLVLGTIRHQTLEQATLAEEELVSSLISTMEFSEVFALYEKSYASLLRKVISDHSNSLRLLSVEPLDAYYHALPTLHKEARVRSMNTFSFLRHSGLEGQQLWKALTPKIFSEIKIESEELQLIGIVDQLHDHGSHIVPVELKTGKMPKQGVWLGHRIQAAAYALMLRELKKDRIVHEAVVHYLDFNEKRSVVMNPFMKEEIISLVQEVQELLSNTLLPEFCEFKQKCASCGLRSKCYDAELMQSAVSSLSMPAAAQSTLV